MTITVREKLFKCPVEATLAVLGGKWKMLILFNLQQGTLRFGELRRLLPPEITQQMLTQQLRDLETDGVVHRKVYAEVPPRVEYSLTPFGRTLEPVLSVLASWGTDYLGQRGEAAFDLKETESAPLPV